MTIRTMSIIHVLEIHLLLDHVISVPDPFGLDLYNKVLLFCLISLALSNREASYFGYVFSFTLQVTSYFL